MEWQRDIDASYKVKSKFKVWAGFSGADFTDAELIGLGTHRNPLPGFLVRLETLFGRDSTQVRSMDYRFF